ncbi:MAG: DUF4416 family protein [Desulfatibacillaceae bacterium]
MSAPAVPEPARLVVGVLCGDRALFSPVLDELVDLYGAVDMLSPWMSFGYTDYYAPEMGKPLFRRVASLVPCVDQGTLPAIKLATNALEQRYARDGKRRVNLDPGILTPERFVLATGKNFVHRIYLSHGIYADLTLMYHKGGFRTLPWTYPDYAEAEMQVFLRKVRDKYMAARRLGLIQVAREPEGVTR